jgi:hypothetical protein
MQMKIDALTSWGVNFHLRGFKKRIYGLTWTVVPMGAQL